MAGIADRLGIDGLTKELRLGDTFNKASKATAYHTIRYDFKPQSIDTQKMGTVEVIENREVTITLPHREGSGQSQTVFMGNEKPIAKECLLVIDHNTGEIVLERIMSHIAVKKTREEGSSRIRPPTPLNQDPTPQKSPLYPSRGNPTGSSPPKSRPSPSHHMKVLPTSKMSPQRSSSSVPTKSPRSSFMPTIGSMPMFGLETPSMEDKVQEAGLLSDASSDSDSNPAESSPPRSRATSSPHMKVLPTSKMSPHRNSSSVPSKSPKSTMPSLGSMPMFGMETSNVELEEKAQETSLMTDSSSNSDSNSGSSSSSDSDSDSEPDQTPQKESNGPSSAPATILKDDLLLSEDDSDSD